MRISAAVLGYGRAVTSGGNGRTSAADELLEAARDGQSGRSSARTLWPTVGNVLADY